MPTAISSKDRENDSEQRYITLYNDIHTIEHKSKKTGKIMHYNLAQVKRFIKTYEKNLQRAIDKSDADSERVNRESLEYWLGRRKELFLKTALIQISASE